MSAISSQAMKLLESPDSIRLLASTWYQNDRITLPVDPIKEAQSQIRQLKQAAADFGNGPGLGIGQHSIGF